MSRKEEDYERLERVNARLLEALEAAFENCMTSGSFHPTTDWMKMADAVIREAKGE